MSITKTTDNLVNDLRNRYTIQDFKKSLKEGEAINDRGWIIKNRKRLEASREKW